MARTMMFQGSMTALITPLRDGKVDAKAFEKIIEDQIAGGTTAVVPCGSTGESATMSHDEHIEVVRLVLDIVGGRIPVIAGTGSNSTSEAIALTKHAKEAGAAAALLISPYYNRPTQEGIYQHYRAVAEASRLPLIVYNIPGRTGSKIEATTIARLAQIDNVIGLKEATGSLDEVQEVIRLCGDNLEIYSGDDSLTLPVMAVGGLGVISVTSNVAPKALAALTTAALAGDWNTARQRHYDLLPLMKALFQESSPIPVKAAMSMLGYCRDELRLPLLPMSDVPRAQLRAELQRRGML